MRRNIRFVVPSLGKIRSYDEDGSAISIGATKQVMIYIYAAEDDENLFICGAGIMGIILVH